MLDGSAPNPAVEMYIASRQKDFDKEVQERSEIHNIDISIAEVEVWELWDDILSQGEHPL